MRIADRKAPTDKLALAVGFGDVGVDASSQGPFIGSTTGQTGVKQDEDSSFRHIGPAATPGPEPRLFQVKYRPDIDGLRAIAVLAVVSFHAFPNALRGGFIGVDIFFVISGFLISTIIIDNLEHRTFSIGHFYARRIRRIFPALALVLVASFAFGWIVLTPDEYKQLGKHIAGGAAFVSNFVLLKEKGYFDTAADAKPLLHLWSLGVEEQFYIAWPVLLWLGWKRRFHLLAVVIVIAVLSFAVNVANIGTRAVSVFYSPITRFWELMVGSIVAYAALHRGVLLSDARTGDMRLREKLHRLLVIMDRTSIRDIVSILGVSLVLVGFVSITKERQFPGWWALSPTLGAALVISAGPGSWFNRTILSNRLFVWFGLISFPLYLWHWPLLSFARIIESGTPSLMIRVGIVSLSVVLAWITYRVIERPIRFGHQGRVTVFALVIVMTVTGAAGYYTFKADGLRARLGDETLIELFSKYPHEPFHNSLCDSLFAETNGFTACLLSKPSEPTIAIVGDSHSNQYYKSMVKHFGNENVINLAVWSCLPFATDVLQSQMACRGKSQQVLDFIRNNPSVTTIYLAGFWGYLAAGKFSAEEDGWRHVKPLTPEERLSFIRNGQQFLDSLTSIGRSVIVIRDIPDLGFNVKSCFDFRPVRLTDNRRESCAISRAEYETRAEDYDNALSQVLSRFPQVRTFDPKDVLCDRVSCWAARDNVPLYFNGDHLTVFGADLVISRLLAQVAGTR